jgi:hypothetical protein
MSYKEPKKRTFYARDIFRDLCFAKPAISRMKGQGKLYDSLIDVLLAVGEEDPYPSSKSLQQQFNLSAGQLKKLIDELYEDFMEGISQNAALLRFPVVVHHFYVKSYDGEVVFDCQLPVTPRVGEKLELPFLWAQLGRSSCYITEVKHTLENDTVTVEVWARVGSYNQHREYLRDKAEFEKRIGWGNRFEHDYAVDKQLGEIFPDKGTLRNSYTEPGQTPGQYFKNRRY